MILRFYPILKSVIWGGEKLRTFKRLTTDQRQIGESWELSDVEGHVSVVCGGELDGQSLHDVVTSMGERLLGRRGVARWQAVGCRFPLLIKFIDAARDLSVQVHPDDDLAMRRHGTAGKTEMWYAMSGSDPDARLLVGLRRPMSPEEYSKAIADHTIVRHLRSLPCKPGDVFYLPAGRIHSIGAGCMVAEIQETSDITYRIYDYGRVGADGRPRQLHTKESMAAIRWDDCADDVPLAYEHSATDARTDVVQSPFFHASVVNIVHSITLRYVVGRTFIIYMCVDGVATIDVTDADASHAEATLRAGDTVLLPATTSLVTLSSERATLLEVTC